MPGMLPVIEPNCTKALSAPKVHLNPNPNPNPKPYPNPYPDPDPNPNSNEVSATGPRREGAGPCGGGRGVGAHSERREHGRALRGLPAAAARHTEGTAAPGPTPNREPNPRLSPHP